jgi:hypothetical protein
MLAWCNIGEGRGAAIGFVLGVNMVSTMILATGLAFVIGYYDPYAQNYVIKTSSSWRHGKYSRYKTAGVSLALLIPGFMHAALTEMGLGIILPAGFAASCPPMYWTMGRGQQQGAKVITD